jgi:hypothetical protein
MLAQLPSLRVLDDIIHKTLIFWLYVVDCRHYHRCSLGQLRLGNLLELGPKRDLVPDHLVYLCGGSPCPFCQRMGRSQDRLVFHRRL